MPAATFIEQTEGEARKRFMKTFLGLVIVTFDEPNQI
jgi:hypothetical protein